jgi:hypothetical protein
MKAIPHDAGIAGIARRETRSKALPGEADLVARDFASNRFARCMQRPRKINATDQAMQFRRNT